MWKTNTEIPTYFLFICKKKQRTPSIWFNQNILYCQMYMWINGLEQNVYDMNKDILDTYWKCRNQTRERKKPIQKTRQFIYEWPQFYFIINLLQYKLFVFSLFLSSFLCLFCFDFNVNFQFVLSVRTAVLFDENLYKTLFIFAWMSVKSRWILWMMRLRFVADMCILSTCISISFYMFAFFFCLFIFND